MTSLSLFLSFFLFPVALGIVVSGCVSGWHDALDIGIGEYLISFGLCTLGYLSLCLCLAEMSSIISFSGGSFGYVRCTLSPFIGYLVGLCDCLQSVLFSAYSVYMISRSLSIATTGVPDSYYHPLWWLAIYITLISMSLPGGKCFWNTMTVFTALTIIMLLIYCLGNASKTDFNYWAMDNHRDDTAQMTGYGAFDGSTFQFFHHMLAPTVCFVGVDLITLYSDEVIQPEQTIPRGMCVGFILCVFFAWWVTLTIVSINPGVSKLMIFDGDLVFPMHYGFGHIFSSTYEIENLLMTPTLFSAVMGFMFAAGRQMSAMSKSGLLPHFLSRTYEGNDHKVPLVAMLVTAGIGYVAMLCQWGFAPDEDDIFEMAMVGAIIVYIFMFWTFLVFRTKYSSMERHFRNPLGIISAIYGILYFSCVLVTLFFVQLQFHQLIAFIPFIILGVIYYYLVVDKRQFFSKEEQQRFMKAYILNGKSYLILIILLS